MLPVGASPHVAAVFRRPRPKPAVGCHWLPPAPLCVQVVTETTQVAQQTLGGLYEQGQQVQRAQHGVQQVRGLRSWRRCRLWQRSSGGGAPSLGRSPPNNVLLRATPCSCLCGGPYLQIEEDVAHAGRMVAFMSRFCCFRGGDSDAERERCRADSVQRWVPAAQRLLAPAMSGSWV